MSMTDTDKNKSLIIGGTSLFGRYLIPRLIRRGEDVTATYLKKTDIENDDLVKYAGSEKCTEWVEMDVLDKEGIISVLKSYMPDVIYDLAVQNSVGYAWKEPAETVDINVIGALNLFDAVRSIDGYKPRIIMAGSGEEYGRNDFDRIPMSEELQPRPNNIFASTKVCQALLANIYHRAYGLDVITLRTFNEIGPGMSKRFSVSNFCMQFARAAKEGRKKFKLHVGNINIERDYTDVRDLTQAFIEIADKGKGGEIYNAGRGNAVSVRNVIEMLEEISGVKADIIVDPSRMRPIDTPKFESDNSKIEKDTGWRAVYSLRDTIKDMYDHVSS